MELVRSWLGRSSTALGASLIAPAAAILAAAIVSVGGGGPRALGSLSQLIRGPQVAPNALLDSGTDTLAGRPSVVLARPPAGRETGALGGAGGDTGSGRGRPDAGGRGRERDRDRPDRRGGDRGGSPGGGGGGGTAPGGGGGSEPPAGSTPLRELGDRAKDVTNQAPAPVSGLTAEAIDQIVEAGEQLAPRSADPVSNGAAVPQAAPAPAAPAVPALP